MVNKCCVPFCKGNYDKSTKAHVFRFPKDEVLKQKWVAAIGRENYTPSKHSRVCHSHFTAEEVLWIQSCFDFKNNKLVTAPLSKPQLEKDAVPSIFLERPANFKLFKKKSVRSTVEEGRSNFTEELENCMKQERREQVEGDSNSRDRQGNSIKHERLDVAKSKSDAADDVPNSIKREDVDEAAHERGGPMQRGGQDVNEDGSDAADKSSCLIKQEADEDVCLTQSPKELCARPYSFDCHDLPCVHQTSNEVSSASPTELSTMGKLGSVVVTLEPEPNTSLRAAWESTVATREPSPEASPMAECKAVVVNLDPSPELSAELKVRSNFATLKNLLNQSRGEMDCHEMCADTRRVKIFDNSFKHQFHPKSFSTISEFNKHRAILTGEAVFKCYRCKQTFHSRLHYIRHKYVHADERIFQCELCQKSFYSRPHLKRHQYIHSCQMKFQCHLCQRRFAKKCHLETHLVAHTGERPYKCQLCHKHFSTTSSLVIHLVAHTGERPYECRLCPKRYSSRSQLKRHETSHAAEKPYVCQLCPRSFSTSTYLRMHQMVHTGEKKFKCKLCPKEFKQKSGLRIHDYVHSGISYKCPLCPKQYTTRARLKNHQESPHPAPEPIRSQLYVRWIPVTFLTKSG